MGERIVTCVALWFAFLDAIAVNTQCSEACLQLNLLISLLILGLAAGATVIVWSQKWSWRVRDRILLVLSLISIALLYWSSQTLEHYWIAVRLERPPQAVSLMVIVALAVGILVRVERLRQPD